MVDGKTGIPDWLMEGRTTLIHKGGETRDPANYRPIACLNTAYLSELHVVLPFEQQSMRTGSWGTIKCLLLDQTIETYTRSYKRPLSAAWVDFLKAFDLVPHAHILHMLEILRAPPPKSRRHSGGRSTAYNIRNNITISHLFYMDDLKVYSPSKSELEKAIRVVEKASRAIGMELGLKSVPLHTVMPRVRASFKRGRTEPITTSPYPSGGQLKILGPTATDAKY
eukprot:gene16571-biopygen13999